MSTSLTESIPPIPIGESGKRVVVFMLELLREQSFCPAFTDIIVRLVYEQPTVEPMVIQRLDEGNTLLVFVEGENIEKLCWTLWTIIYGTQRMWHCHTQRDGEGRGAMLGGKRRECVGESTSMQIPRLTLELQHEISCPSAVSQVVGKMPKISTFIWGPSQKGEVSFLQRGFEVRSVIQCYTEVTMWEKMVWSWCGATTDLVQYLGPQVLLEEIINKLELVHGTVASFDILMQIFYKLQQGEMDKVTLYVTQLEGALNVVWQEYVTMLSAWEMQQHLRDYLFHGLCKQLCDSMCYLYVDMRITYPELITAVWKAKLEQKDWPGEGVCARSTWVEGKYDIVRLSEQITQLQVVVQKPQNTTISNLWQLGSVRDGNDKQGNTMSWEKIKSMVREVTTRGYICFWCKGLGPFMSPQAPL